MTSVLALAATALALALPTGTYRTTMTSADAAKAGARPVGFVGTWTLQMKSGQWVMKWTRPVGHPYFAPPKGGGYTRSGSAYVFTDNSSGGTVTARARYYAGTLRFVVSSSTSPSLRVLFAAHPWRRVG